MAFIVVTLVQGSQQTLAISLQILMVCIQMVINKFLIDFLLIGYMISDATVWIYFRLDVLTFTQGHSE